MLSRTRKNKLSYLLFLPFISSIILITPGISRAQDEKTPMFSMGIGASYSYFSQFEDSRYININGSWGISGGLILERMFNNYLGFHSGLWYAESKGEMENSAPMNEDGSPDGPPPLSDIHVKFFTVPFYMIGSYSLYYLSIDLLLGLTISYIRETKLKGTMDTPMGTFKIDWDITKYTNHAQLGAGGGLRVRLHFFRFVDIFIAGTAARYFTDFINADDNENSGEEGAIDLYMYNYGITAGVLLKTF